VAFFVQVYASVAVLAALWNSYLSCERQWAETVTQPKSWGQQVLLTEQIKLWADSQEVGVTLLDIRLSLSDVAVLGAITLMVVSFYYCMCMRRANHETGTC
jgi:hypothetical protein